MHMCIRKFYLLKLRVLCSLEPFHCKDDNTGRGRVSVQRKYIWSTPSLCCNFVHFHSLSGCGRPCLWKYRIAELYVCIYIYIFVCVCTHTSILFMKQKWSLLLKPGEMIWCGRNVKITGYTLSSNRQKRRLIATLYQKILLLLPSVKCVLIARG